MAGSNPTLNEKIFSRSVVAGTDSTAVFTVNGVINKATVMMVLVLLGACTTWGLMARNPQGSELLGVLGIGGFIGGLISCLVCCFSPRSTIVAGPIYALCQGIVLGIISALFNKDQPGIVTQAVVLTFGIFLAMLGAYRTRLIQATAKFRAIVLACTGGIFITMLVSLGLYLITGTTPIMNQPTPLGIGLSLIILVIAAFNLIIDFDFIEKLATDRTSKDMEWYAAFGMIVTLLWIYLRVLRLLRQLR